MLSDNAEGFEKELQSVTVTVCVYGCLGQSWNYSSTISTLDTPKRSTLDNPNGSDAGQSLIYKRGQVKAFQLGSSLQF